MKKQILFLAFLLLAAFANVNMSYGACNDDALHPMAGKLYHYVVTTSGGGTAKSFQWAVTTSPNVVTAGTFVTTIAPGATTFTWANQTTADVSITWSPTVIAAAMAGTRYYVAVKYVATNSEGCDVDNVKVYTIDPVNMFQIDLANVDNAGAAKATANVCTSPIVSATVNGAGVDYDFGTTTIYVKVTARNFSGSWDMTVGAPLLAALGTSETGTLTWATTTAAAGTAVIPGTPITIPETTADPTDNEVIYLKLVVDHNKYEGLAASAFPFAVDGADKAGNPDVDNTNCTPESDSVTQTILERPTITNGTVVGTYYPVNP